MDLTDYRAQIDAVDRQLIGLLEHRMDICRDIAAYKAANGLPVLDAGRETQKLAAVREDCRPDTADAIADIFAGILAASRAFQKSLLGENAP